MEKIKPFHKRLVELIDEKRHRITSVARAVNMPISTLSGWTAGAKPRDIDKLREVAKLLQTDFYHLLFGETDPFASPSSINFQQDEKLTLEVTIKKRS